MCIRDSPKAVLGLFPSDQVVAKHARFRRDLKQGIKLAAAGDNIVVLGVKPTRPETGYGYIETGAASGDAGVLRVRRFREKPAEGLARKFVAEGNYYWNSGIFLWSAQTLVDALKKYLPETATLLEKIAATWGDVYKRQPLGRTWLAQKVEMLSQAAPSYSSRVKASGTSARSSAGSRA